VQNETIGTVNYRLFEIQYFTNKKVNYIPNIISKAYLVKNLDTDKNYIQYKLSDNSINLLEEELSTKFPKLEIDELFFIQELEYEQQKSIITIVESKRDYIINGKNSEDLLKKINDSLLTLRLGEGEGLFTIIYRKWNPNILEVMPFPVIQPGDSFNLEVTDNIVVLTGNKFIVKLLDHGNHEWFNR